MQKIGDIKNVKHAQVIQSQNKAEDQIIGNIEDSENILIVQAVYSDLQELKAVVPDDLSSEAILSIINQELEGQKLNEKQLSTAIETVQNSNMPEFIRSSLNNIASSLSIGAGVLTLLSPCDPKALAVALPTIGISLGLFSVASIKKICKKIKEYLND